MSSFNERFNQLMVENHLSVKECAVFVDLPWQTVYSYCQRDIDARAYNLIKIAEAFNVTTDWLLGVSDIRERFYDRRVVSEEETGRDEETDGADDDADGMYD